MTTLKVKIEPIGDFYSSLAEDFRAAEALALAGASRHTYSFPSWKALHQTLTPPRLEIIQAMAAQGPLSVEEIARRVGHDVEAVEADVVALRNCGVIDKAADGCVEFPYDRIHLDLEIEAAA
jgi:predicted transcriptional regulator